MFSHFCGSHTLEVHNNGPFPYHPYTISVPEQDNLSGISENKPFKKFVDGWTYTAI